MEAKHVIAIIVGIAVLLLALTSFTGFFTGKAVSKIVSLSSSELAPGEKLTITINPDSDKGVASTLYVIYNKETEEIEKDRVEALCGVDACKEQITKEYNIPTDFEPGNYLIRIYDNKRKENSDAPFNIKEQFCADSDGGKNQYEYGEVRISSAPGFIFKDSCKYDSATQKYSISEKYCENEQLKTETIECPSTCNDGVCIKVE